MLLSPKEPETEEDKKFTFKDVQDIIRIPDRERRNVNELLGQLKVKKKEFQVQQIDEYKNSRLNRKQFLMNKKREMSDGTWRHTRFFQQRIKHQEVFEE